MIKYKYLYYTLHSHEKIICQIPYSFVTSKNCMKISHFELLISRVAFRLQDEEFSVINITVGKVASTKIPQ